MRIAWAVIRHAVLDAVVISTIPRLAGLGARVARVVITPIPVVALKVPFADVSKVENAEVPAFRPNAR